MYILKIQRIFIEGPVCGGHCARHWEIRTLRDKIKQTKTEAIDNTDTMYQLSLKSSIRYADPNIDLVRIKYTLTK